MKTSTHSPHRTSFRSSPHRSRHQGTATEEHWRSPADGGQRDPHDGARAEVPCRLSLRRGDRLPSMLEDFAPTIPDHALDMHTMKGNAMGRGLDHFRKEGARLVPEPTGDDPYEAEACRLWTIKQQSK